VIDHRREELNVLRASIATMHDYNWVSNILVFYSNIDVPLYFGNLTKEFNKVHEEISLLNYGQGYHVSIEEGGWNEVAVRNQAIELASQFNTEYLLQCDADEFFLENFGEELVYPLQKYNFMICSRRHAVSLDTWSSDGRIAFGVSDPQYRVLRTDTNIRFGMNEAVILNVAFRNKTIHCLPKVQGIGVLAHDLPHLIHIRDLVPYKTSRIRTDNNWLTNNAVKIAARDWQWPTPYVDYFRSIKLL